jgi:hypothetical protein
MARHQRAHLRARRGVSEGRKDRVQEHGLPDRLAEVGGHAQLPTALGVPSLPHRGQHHDRCSGEVRTLRDPLGHLETVHIRHLVVEQDERKRIVCGPRGVQGL